MPARGRQEIFKSLGQAVMHGGNSFPAAPSVYTPQMDDPGAVARERERIQDLINRGETISFTPHAENIAWLNQRQTSLPPRPPTPPRMSASQQVNPAVRAAAQAEVKEGKEAAEARPAHKGKRKAYVRSLAVYLTKEELIKKIQGEQERENKEAVEHNYSEERMNKLRKNQELYKFSLMKQYNLSKHEPLDGNNSGLFGKNYGAGSDFFYGSYPNQKGWNNMSPAEKDALMAQENTPAQVARRQEQQQSRQREVQNQEYAQQSQQAAERWAALPPAEQQQIIYNRQLADYNEALERQPYMDMMVQPQQQFGQQMGAEEISPVMLNDLMQGIQNQQTRYVPMRPRRSIHDRVMSSFDPNMFSPEFIPEE